MKQRPSMSACLSDYEKFGNFSECPQVPTDRSTVSGVLRAPVTKESFVAVLASGQFLKPDALSYGRRVSNGILVA